MYGLLISDDHQLLPNLAFMWPTYYCESAPMPPTAAAVRQMDAVLAQHQPALNTADRSHVRAELLSLIAWLSDCTDAQLEFVLHAALQHHNLPPAERLQREARITSVLTGYFGPEATWTSDQATVLNGVRRTAVLTPDDLLDNHLRSVCGSKACVWAQERALRKPSALTATEIADRNALFMCARSIAGPRKEFHQGLEGLYYHALPGERSQRLQRLERIAASSYKVRALEYFGKVSTADTRGPLVLRVDALWEALTALDEWMGDPDRDPRTEHSTELIDLAIARMKARQLAAERRSQAFTLAALRQGVNLGELGRRSLQAAQALDDWILALSANWTQTILKAQPPAPDRETPRSLILTPNQPPEVARTWRTKRSLEIYKGPVARRRTPAGQAVNRTLARQQLQDRAGKVRKPVQTKPSTATDTWTELDVDELLRDTLVQSANFYLAETNDLIDLARTLGTPEPAIHACAGIAESLVSIIKSEASDELQARDTYALAEQAISDLRRQVTMAEAATRLRAQFDKCLTLAIAQENMVHGKAHGGVIAQPLAARDWSWVQARYHRRWLSGISRYTTEDGISTPLPDHCALALHVTAKSLSGYAFDISVHLWYRQAGSTSAPSSSTEPYPPMNEADWYDSFIPCAVLHIPHAT